MSEWVEADTPRYLAKLLSRCRDEPADKINGRALPPLLFRLLASTLECLLAIE
jgi:hypothetical protein